MKRWAGRPGQGGGRFTVAKGISGLANPGGLLQSGGSGSKTTSWPDPSSLSG